MLKGLEILFGNRTSDSPEKQLLITERKIEKDVKNEYAWLKKSGGMNKYIRVVQDETQRRIASLYR
jgi:hypothetical protein